MCNFRLPPRSRLDLRSYGIYTAFSGNFLPTFQHDLSVPSSRVKKSKTKEIFLLWFLDPVRSDRQVIPKRLQGITTVRCVISHNSADLCLYQHLLYLHADIFWIMTPYSLVEKYGFEVAALKTTGWNFWTWVTWSTWFLRILEMFGHPCLAPLLSERKLKVGLDTAGGWVILQWLDGGDCAPLVRGWRVFLKATLWRIDTLRLVTINQKKIFWNKEI